MAKHTHLQVALLSAKAPPTYRNQFRAKSWMYKQRPTTGPKTVPIPLTRKVSTQDHESIEISVDYHDNAINPIYIGLSSTVVVRDR